MHQFPFDRPERSGSMIHGGALCAVWLLGSSLGLLAARLCGDTPEELIFRAGASDLHFPDACIVTLLPFLLSAFAVFFFHRFGLFLAAFLRGGCLGFSLGILMELGGVWLAVLLLFSGLFFCPVLLWYLWRRLEYGQRGVLRDAVCCTVVGLLLSAVDTWVVAPFLVAALSY